MERKLITSDSTFEHEIAYSRAVALGDWVFVSGTTGFDYLTMAIPEGNRGSDRAMLHEHRGSVASGRQQPARCGPSDLCAYGWNRVRLVLARTAQVPR